MTDVAFYIKDCCPPSGILSYVYTLSRELVSRGISVDIVTDGSCNLSLEGIYIYSLNTHLDLVRFIKLKKYLKLRKPKLIVSNLCARNPLLALLKTIDKELNIACIYHLPPKRWNLFKSIVINRFDSIIAVSSNVRRRLENLALRKDIEVFRNPFDFGLIKKLACEKLEPDLEVLFSERKVVINVGRFDDEQKGILDLLEIFRAVREECREAFLLLVGDGLLKDELIRKIRYLNLEESSLLIGPVTNPFKYIARASVFAFTSRYESLGRVVIESMYLGTPVVGFSSEGDYSDILSMYGLCVPDRDKREFVKKLLYILRNPLKIKLDGEILGEYDVKTVADKFISYFHRLWQDKDFSHASF